MKRAVVALVATLVLAGAAQAGTSHLQSNVAGKARPSGTSTLHVRTKLRVKGAQSLYTSTFLDTVADGVSGWPLQTLLEDDPVEWAYSFGVDANVLGFVCITVQDPNDFCYHRVFLGPVPTVTFMHWFNGQAPTYYDAAVAVMTITHESKHYGLQSADEGRVNACALQAFPSVIDTYFQIHPTITQTVTKKKVVWKKKRVRVRRHGRWIWKVKRVKHVVTVQVQQTVQNPDYVNLVSAAQQFYASQPPPYNTGTCY